MLETMDTILSRVSSEVDERVAVGGIDVIGLPTGFAKVDLATLGLRKNAYYVVGARASVGKTAWGVSLSKNVTRAGKKVIYITLEMSSDLLVYRLLSSLAGISSLDIERGKLNKDQELRVKRASEELRELDIRFYDRTVATDGLTTLLCQAQNDNPADLIVLDYLTLVRAPNPNASEYERTTAVSEFVRMTARDLDLPIVALAQLNRESERREDKTPILSDLRGSGGIEQDAHAVFLLHRPHYYDKMYNGATPKNEEDDALILIAKNRQGPTGRLNATFIANRMEWLDPSSVRQQPQSLVDMVRAR